MISATQEEQAQQTTVYALTATHEDGRSITLYREPEDDLDRTVDLLFQSGYLTVSVSRS